MPPRCYATDAIFLRHDCRIFADFHATLMPPLIAAFRHAAFIDFAAIIAISPLRFLSSSSMLMMAI